MKRPLVAGFPVLFLIAVALLSPAAAQGLTPPKVFLKELNSSNQLVGDWKPLAGARMHSVTGFEVGVRLQNTGQSGNSQRILVEMVSVPDGHPDQSQIYSLCFAVSGEPGKIASADERVLYEGDGTYRLAVTVSTGSDASTNCQAGSTSTGSFTARSPTRIAFLGHLLLVDPRNHPPFSGLQIVPPTGFGGTNWLCARDPQVTPSGRLTGSEVTRGGTAGAATRRMKIDSDNLFRSVGRWACVARAVGGGVKPGPWSRPTPTRVVQTGFYGAPPGGERLRDWKGPKYRLTLRLGPHTAGGVLRVKLRRRGSRPLKLRTKVGRHGIASIGFRLPRVKTIALAYFLGTISFGGTRFVAARRAFPEFAVQEVAAGGGRVDVEFTSPCAPHRC